MAHNGRMCTPTRAAAAVLAAALLAAPASCAKAATPTPTQIECSAVNRAVTAWEQATLARLAALPATTGAATRTDLGLLTEDGKALSTAIAGYGDQPAKELAAKAADYNVAIGFAATEYQLTGKVSAQSVKEAAVAADAVRAAFVKFVQGTCGGAV